MGFSGVRQVVVDTILALLNADIIPAVHEHGSLGASGDLAPLAHVGLALIGEGECAEAMVAAGIRAGHAAGQGRPGVDQRHRRHARDAGAGTRRSRHARAHRRHRRGDERRGVDGHRSCLRRRPDGVATASAARPCRPPTCGGCSTAVPIVASHRTDDPRVQDAYSLRCTPQVHGAARDTITFARSVAEIELVSAIDNPSVLPDGRVESCGHFHGAPVGFACDFLAIAAAEVGAIAERRTDRMLDRTRSHGLPPFLAEDAGVNSGMMIAHYTQAAMVAENRRLASPASVDSLPTSAMQEDHVSMGWGAARKLRRVGANLGRIIACELVCAARGIELRHPGATSRPDRCRGGGAARRGCCRERDPIDGCRRSSAGPRRW